MTLFVVSFLTVACPWLDPFDWSMDGMGWLVISGSAAPFALLGLILGIIMNLMVRRWVRRGTLTVSWRRRANVSLAMNGLTLVSVGVLTLALLWH